MNEQQEVKVLFERMEELLDRAEAHMLNQEEYIQKLEKERDDLRKRLKGAGMLSSYDT